LSGPHTWKDDDMASDLTPALAWQKLCRGNERFIAGAPEHPHQDWTRREQTAGQQAPFAVLFGCMDSRVSAEIIFDRGLGDLAVVRTAGHVVVLKCPLVVVLGHDGCGAILAALAAYESGQMPGGYVRDIVERVVPSMVTARQHGQSLEDVDATELMEEHVRHTVQLIAERSSPIADRIQSGEVAIVGAGYRLSEGRVSLLDAVGKIE
jgi:carbonic anhydrase